MIMLGIGKLAGMLKMHGCESDPLKHIMNRPEVLRDIGSVFIFLKFGVR